MGTLNGVNFIGIRYLHQKFESKDGIFSNSPKSNEYFNTYQLWGKFPINQKFSISTIIPYQDLERKFIDRQEAINGAGDVTIMGWYQLGLFKNVKNKSSEYAIISKEPSNHSLEFGLGIKIPTGKFEEVLSNRVNPGFQLGTGSFDAIFAVSHSYKKEKIGVSTALTYYLKGENKNNYRFGNQFSYTTNLFYTISKKQYNLTPFIGISGNIYDNIQQFDETIVDTNGTVFNGSLGTEISVNKFIFGANYILPINNNLFGGNVKPKNSFSIYLNFIL